MQPLDCLLVFLITAAIVRLVMGHHPRNILDGTLKPGQVPDKTSPLAQPAPRGAERSLGDFQDDRRDDSQGERQAKGAKHGGSVSPPADDASGGGQDAAQLVPARRAASQRLSPAMGGTAAALAPAP
jgi:hypothetical protein